MEKLIVFCDAEGNLIFSACAEIVPRIGEFVTYSMQAHDRKAWNDEAWEDKQAITGKEWRVVDVCHEFRKFSVMDTETQVVFIKVTPNAGVTEQPGRLTGVRLNVWFDV